MRRSLALALVLSLAPAAAHADLAVEPLREVLVGAGPAVRACVVAQHLPAGRYVVQVIVATTGSVESATLVESPAPLAPAATECLLAAFRRLQFLPGPAPPPDHVWVHGRRARIPYGHGAGPAASKITISWPFIITAS